MNDQRRSHKFTFTISDLGIILGKAPVTLRGWERDGLVYFPRNGRGDRAVSIQGLREIITRPEIRGRIADDRLRLIEACLTMFELLEKK
jgi:hypothetical protein